MKKRIAILGGGPAGLGLAVRILSRHPEVELLIFEKKSQAGGLAISFERNGLYFDYGSHRLHPATEPEILDDIKGLLGGISSIGPETAEYDCWANSLNFR